MRVCDHPSALPHFGEKHEYGWDGWLGTYFINLPESETTMLFFQNVKDSGTCGATRRCRNILAAAL